MTDLDANTVARIADAIRVALEEACPPQGVHAEDLLAALAFHASTIIARAPTPARRGALRSGLRRAVDDGIAEILAGGLLGPIRPA